jgi:hypothetical protein
MSSYNLSTPSYPDDKSAGDTFSSTDANTLKTALQTLWANITGIVGSSTQANDTINNIDSRVSGLEKAVYSITADYAITDSDGYGTINVNPTGGDITVTLPTAADNTSREIIVKVTHAGGKVTVDGEGAETINGHTNIYLQRQYDYIAVYCDGTEWFIKAQDINYETGWQNRSDWTGVVAGTSAFDYDNLSGTFIIGETITEATSGNTGIIQSDDGSTIYVKNVTGTGIWTNNREITGSTSGATADINEASGSNKNQDTYIYHGFNLDANHLTHEIYINSTADFDLSNKVDPYSTFANRDCGAGQYDQNNLYFSTGSGGYAVIHYDSSGTVVDGEDWYINTIVKARY